MVFPIVLTYKKEVDFNNFNSDQLVRLNELIKSENANVTEASNNKVKFYVPFFFLDG